MQASDTQVSEPVPPTEQSQQNGKAELKPGAIETQSLDTTLTLREHGEKEQRDDESKANDLSIVSIQSKHIGPFPKNQLTGSPIAKPKVENYDSKKSTDSKKTIKEPSAQQQPDQKRSTDSLQPQERSIPGTKEVTFTSGGRPKEETAKGLDLLPVFPNIPIYPTQFHKEEEISPTVRLRGRPQERDTRSSLQKIIMTKKEAKATSEETQSNTVDHKVQYSPKGYSKEELIDHLQGLSSEELKEVLARVKKQPADGKKLDSGKKVKKTTDKPLKLTGNRLAKANPFYFPVEGSESRAESEEEGQQPLKVYQSDGYVDPEPLDTFTAKRVKEYKKRADQFNKSQNGVVVSNGLSGKVGRLIRTTNKMLESKQSKRKITDTMRYMNLFYNLSVTISVPTSIVGYCIVHCPDKQAESKDYFRSIVEQNFAQREYPKPTSKAAECHVVWSYRWDKSLPNFKSSTLTSLAPEKAGSRDNLGFIINALSTEKLPSTSNFIKDTKLFKRVFWKSGIDDTLKEVAQNFKVINLDSDFLFMSNHLSESQLFHRFDVISDHLRTKRGEIVIEDLQDQSPTGILKKQLEMDNFARTVQLDMKHVEELKSKDNFGSIMNRLNEMKYPLIVKKSVYCEDSAIATSEQELKTILLGHMTEAALIPDHQYPIPSNQIVVQELVNRPLLLNGYKFDMRCFVLVVKMFDNVTAFFYTEGIARICTSLFSAKTPRNGSMYMANRSSQLTGSIM